MAKKKEAVKKAPKKEAAQEEPKKGVVNHRLGCVEYMGDRFPGKPE